MPLSFIARIRNGYGNIYTPHAGSMIIQVQRETGLANRTIVLSERQVRVLRMLGSRIGVATAVVFVASWLLFAVQSVRVPVLSGRIAQLERDNQRIDSLQAALARMNRRYEQVNQMLRTVSPSSRAVTRPETPAKAGVAQQPADTSTPISDRSAKSDNKISPP